MGCSNNAKQGGLSILTNTKKIYKHMMTKQPEYLKILKEPFIFERRVLITQIQIHLKTYF